MRFALFAAIAATALVGGSCSVQDFSTVVLDKPAISANIDPFLAAAPSDSSEISVGSVMSSLWIGDPDGTEYTSGDAWTTILSLHGVYTDVNLTFVFSPTGHYSWDRLYLLGAEIARNNIANYLDLSRGSDGVVLFGGTQNINVNTTLYFKEPFKCTEKISNLAFNEDFAIPAHDSYKTGYDRGYYDAERDNGIFNHAYYVTGNDGTNTVTNFIDSSLLEWYASANTQGLFDPYALVRFLGLSSSATSYTITIQYGEFAAGANFPLAAYPLYVDVLSDGVVEDTTLCPSLSISTYRGGSIRGNNLFDADFTTTYAGLAVGYPNPAIYNKQYDTFNRISLTLPKNQSYADMRQIGVVSPYAQGFVDGVTSRDGEVQNLTDRILGLEDNLSQYNGMTYNQIYEAGRQAGINAGNAANSMMSGLFGAVLSVPLSIFGGLSEFSVLGVSVMSLIISLLVVAVAVMVLKRFL